MISLKSAREIEIMRRANVIVAEVLEALKERVAPGVTTLDLDACAEEITLKRHAIPAFKGYNVGGRIYPCCLCASINDEIVHGIPSKRALREGDSFRVWSLGSPNEGEGALVQRFFDGIDKYTPNLVSWNGGGFDLPVLHYRGLIHGVTAAWNWSEVIRPSMTAQAAGKPASKYLFPARGAEGHLSRVVFHGLVKQVAARAGLGALGALYSVTLRTVPAYTIRRVDRPIPLIRRPA